MLVSLNRLLLGRSITFSYSFTGEDRILESLYKPLISYNGFYVDVGCNRPRFLSNTFLFYRRGWKGICIDANERLIEKHQYIRPRDKAVCALVSDVAEEKTFYQLSNNVLSTTEKKLLEKYKSEGQKIKTKTILTQTLTSILEKANAPADIDILSIDAEDHDFNVLKSLDFRKFSPRLIIMEIEGFDPNSPDKDIAYQYLLAKGYRLEGSILTNVYFRKASEPGNGQ